MINRRQSHVAISIGKAWKRRCRIRLKAWMRRKPSTVRTQTKMFQSAQRYTKMNNKGYRIWLRLIIWYLGRSSKGMGCCQVESVRLILEVKLKGLYRLCNRVKRVAGPSTIKSCSLSPRTRTCTFLCTWRTTVTGNLQIKSSSSILEIIFITHTNNEFTCTNLETAPQTKPLIWCTKHKKWTSRRHNA